MTPTERTLRARIAANESWARTPDRSARVAPAVEAVLRNFERQVDPDGLLDPEERRKRALNARRAHMSRLRLKRCRNERNT